MDRVTASMVFVTIVDQGSMIAAAKALDMSRSMVSRYLAEMEQWANARLLNRSTRKLSLTPSGERLLEQCRKLQAVVETIPNIDEVEDNSPKGLIRLSCSQSLAQEVLNEFISNFLVKFPRVSIDLQVSNQAVNLIEERIDIAIRITNDLDPNLIARPLGQITSFICASKTYLKAQGVPRHIDQLSQHNCLTYSYFGKSIWQFVHKGEPVSTTVSGNYSSNESMILLDATLRSIGISLQPRYAISSHLTQGKLVQLLANYSPIPLGVFGIYRSRKHMSSAHRLLLDELVNHFSSLDL